MPLKVSLHAVDSKIPNIALMKLSAYHKQRGDEVKLWEPLFDDPDILYLSKVFDFTPDVDWWPDCEISRGGSGYDLGARLTDEQDHTFPDYSLFNCTYALGRITRGCPRNCPWCLVPKMDGTKTYKAYDLSEWYSGQSHIRFLDDNFLFLPDVFCETMEQVPNGVTVEFDALDIRLVNKDVAKALASVRRKKDGVLHFAWDDEKAEPYIENGIKTLGEAGIKPRYLMFYVLIGAGTSNEYDLYRCERLRDLGAYPFVMPYDKKDPYQKKFARWANHKAIFKTVRWEEYR